MGRCASRSAGPVASLAAGLRALDAEVIVVTPVDMLPADVKTHRVLLARLTGSRVAVTPTYGGRGIR